MLDLRYVTQNLEEVVKGLSRRGPGVDLSGVERLAKQRRDLITATERTRHEQKEESQQLGKLMKENPAEGQALREKLKGLSEKVKGGEQEVTQLEEQLAA